MGLRIRRSSLRVFSWRAIRDSSRAIKAAVIIVLLAAAALSVGVVKINTATAAACPCHVFTTNPTPGAFSEPGGIEVGFKFKTSIAGYISGVRFYKDITMTGTHVASLWDNMGLRIAQATFTAETASGWQEVNFTPVAVTANTIYTASVHMTDGQYVATSNYFTSDIVNVPLTAPRDTQAHDGLGNSRQGVYHVDPPDVYPTNSFNAANYWVDVTYMGALNDDPPVVTETDPDTSESSVPLGSSVTATFDLVLDAATVTADTFFVKDGNGNTVPGALSYNSTTKRATFISTNPLATGMTYTATLKGGTGTVIESLDGIALAADHTWSFTTVAADPCPCTLKDKAAPEVSATADDLSGAELGLKVAPQANGYISKIRFYKPIISPENTHIGNIWDNLGNKLASVTFTNETEYGWQEATLGTPLRVYQGSIYIISYGSPSGVYQYSTGALASPLGNANFTAYPGGDTRNASTSSGNGNGVFSSPSVNAYPGTSSPTSNYYWIDAVFSTAATYPDPLRVDNTLPQTNAYGIRADQQFQATFNKAIDPASVNASNVEVFDNAGVTVAVTPTYNTARHQVVLLPAGGWQPDETYTIRLAPTLTASDGNTLGAEHVTTFSIGGAKSTDVAAGLGGPLLVVTSGANAYDSYYAEILRTEGITYFDVKDITTVNASVLANYKAAIVSEMPLAQSQVDLLASWVNDGGNLVAMRPDKKLATLLGLQDAASTRANQYITVDTSSAPGSGIVAESMQYKGDADNYSNATARIVATLYSDGVTATSNPGVTTRSVGTKGGEAMAFTYDLAKSVIMLHQGNQAWAGTDRDGDTTRRSNDLFYGNKAGDVQADWVDMNKVHIPQADEQQRLLVNMLTEATKDTLPMPRFWYLPHDNKAALVLAGDDHAVPAEYGTERRLNDWLNESKTNCSVLDWECVRVSQYLYSHTPISNDRAVQYSELNFDVANHPSNGGGCANFTSQADLAGMFTTNLTAFRAAFPGLPNQVTDRFHCYVWSDWDSMAKVSLANGIRYSLDYVAYPQAWINGKSPLVTGSGMNMRLTDTTGGLLDIYQGMTNFDNTTANSTSINAMLDNAIGSTGYYGMFGSHYDMSDSYHRTLLDAAKARNIPVISAKQSLEWLDGRNDSQFANFSSPSKGKISFTLRAGQGASGLRAMVPMSDGAGTLSTIESFGSNATYTTRTAKGVAYAVFDAVPGEYVVTYSDYNTTTPPGSGSSSLGPSSGTGQSTPTGQSNSRRMTALEKDSEDGEQASPQDSGNAPAEPNPRTTDPSVDDIQRQTDTTEQSSVPWWLWVVIALLLLGGIWFALVARRRKKHDLS